MTTSPRSMDGDGVGALPLSGTGLSPTVEPASGLDGSATSIPSADALVEMIVAWGSIPSAEFHGRYPFFREMRERAFEDWAIDRDTPDGNWAATLGVICEIADELDAQAIEARRAETQSGSVHESAVPEGNAPTPSSPNTPNTGRIA